jgi:type IX secretion system PorP/SprF family membrane protein
MVLAAVLAAFVQAQDPSMSHFYANPLYMNPAMAGVEGPTKLSLGYRNHLPGAAHPYSTYHASFEQYLEALQGGVGIHVMNDRQGGGIINTLSLDAIYAYHLKVSRELMLSGGFQASAGQRSMNPDGLVLPDELAGMASTTLTGYSKVYPDFTVGLAAFRRNVYGGIAVYHLFQPYMSRSKDPNTRLSRRYSAHLGALFSIYEKRLGREILQLSPNLVFLQQDIYQQMNYGLEVLYKNLLAGIWFRQDLRFSYGTLILSVGYAKDPFRFRYSYDAKLSSPDLQIPSMGSHEISMGLVFENLYKSKKRRAIKSPKI